MGGKVLFLKFPAGDVVTMEQGREKQQNPLLIRLWLIRTFINWCRQKFEEKGYYMVAAWLRSLWGLVRGYFSQEERELEKMRVLSLPRRLTDKHLMNILRAKLPTHLQKLVYKEGKERLLEENLIEGEREEDVLRNIYFDLLVGVATAAYQWWLSTEGAKALEDYLRTRTREDIGWWSKWLILKRLAEVILTVWDDNWGYSEKLSQKVQETKEPQEEKETQEAKEAETAGERGFGESVWWDLTQGIPLETYAHDYGFAGIFFGQLRNWARGEGEEDDEEDTPASFYEIVYRKVMKEEAELWKEVRLRLWPPAEVSVNAQSLQTIEDLVGLVPPENMIEIPIIGLKAGMAEVTVIPEGKVAEEEERTEEEVEIFYIFVGVYTDEAGREVLESLCSELSEGRPLSSIGLESKLCFRLGNRYAFTFRYSIFLESFFDNFLFKTATISAEELRRRLLDPSSELERFSVLEDLKEYGMLAEDLVLWEKIVDWINGLRSLSLQDKVKLQEGISEFFGRYYEMQREGGGFVGPTVFRYLKAWVEEAKKILEKWKHLTSPPTGSEAEEFKEDVIKLMGITETRLLSALHGGGGPLTLLTRRGTLEDVLYLIGVRAGVFVPPILRRPQRIGDKKLLLKWLLLASLVKR